MTIDQLFAAYPTVSVAVAYTELILCGSDEGEPTAWDLLMDAGLNPLEVLKAIQEALANETLGKAQEALIESRRPEYLVYLKGRMGAM